MSTLTPPQSPKSPPAELVNSGSGGGGNRLLLSRSIRLLIDKWVKCHDEPSFAKNFEARIRDLHDAIIQELRNVLPPNEVDSETKDSVLGEISQFLGGGRGGEGESAAGRGGSDWKKESGKNGSYSTMDYCVRWVILYIAVTRKADDVVDAEICLIDMILEDTPHLAFENVNMSPLTSECKNVKGTTRHSECDELKANKSTPFHRAAEVNNARALRSLLDGMKRQCRQTDDNRKPRRRLPDWLRPRPGDKPPEDPLLYIVKRVLPAMNQTALLLAAKAGGDGSALNCLLTTLPHIVDDDTDTFTVALDDGRSEIIDKFLQHPKAHVLFAKSNYIIQAIINLEYDEGVSYRQRLAIVQNLIGIAKKDDSQYFDLEVVQMIIQKDLELIWHSMAEAVSTIPSCVLHMAVKEQNVKFVKMFLKDYPDFVTVQDALPISENPSDKDKHYPLWYNNRFLEGSQWKIYDGPKPPIDEKRREIRSEIITNTVRQVRKMKDLSDIFAKSEEPASEIAHLSFADQKARELCFDLSHFNSQSYLVSEFVQSLVNHHENEELLKYEETLQYAEFPALDLNPADKDQIQVNKHLSVERKEAFHVLDWLKKPKGVKKIISLTVPDRLVNPHDEVKIAEKVNSFEVEVLNWRLLDMSISDLSPETKGRLTELHLYSSGKRAVISHWLGKDGIQTLRELKSLYIFVVKEMGSAEWCRDTTLYIRSAFKGKTFLKLTHDNIKIASRFWNPAPHLDNLDEIAKRVAPRLSQFIEGYRELAFKRRRDYKDGEQDFVATKVAIIDNGILAISPKSPEKISGDADGPQDQDKNVKTPPEAPESPPGNNEKAPAVRTMEEVRADFLANKSVWSRIKEGRSFVDESFKLSPWLFASNPHGTQMANLICAVDPLCELYVAKVADGQYGMTAGRVARAINWAIEKKVDIISMSFTILGPTEDEELSTALDLAASKGIVMLCSTHDEGSKVANAWPADHKSECILAVAGCDEYGRPLREIDNDKYMCMLHGENIAAGVIPFLEPNDRITGSSVATALAAGLSSLTLSCDRLASPTRNATYAKDKNGRQRSIRQRFYAMQSLTGSKYVLLDKFGRIDQKIRVGQAVDAEEILDKSWCAVWLSDDMLK